MAKKAITLQVVFDVVFCNRIIITLEEIQRLCEDLQSKTYITEPVEKPVSCQTIVPLPAYIDRDTDGLDHFILSVPSERMLDVYDLFENAKQRTILKHHQIPIKWDKNR